MGRKRKTEEDCVASRKPTKSKLDLQVCNEPKLEHIWAIRPWYCWQFLVIDLHKTKMLQKILYDI